MKLLNTVLATTITIALVGCTRTEPMQETPPQIQQEAPQQQFVEEDDGLSTGEALLAGAAAGALVGHLASSDSHSKYKSSTHYSSKPSTVVKTVPANVNQKASSAVSAVGTKKPTTGLSLNKTSNTSGSSWSSTGKSKSSSFRSSSGFKSSSSSRSSSRSRR